jgi:uncharacterized membrane protein
MKRYIGIIAMLVLVIAMFAVGGALFSQMPAQMVSHWNAAGEVNGTISRFWGVFLFPIISLGLLGLFLIIPRIDPLRINIQKFKGYYYGFIVVCLVYFFYIYVLSLLWNLDLRFDMMGALMPAIGVLFLVVGLMMLKAKRNFFIGIRTPWTLSSDEVWDRTHKLGGRLFIAVGIITAILAAFLSEIAIWVMLGMVLATALFSIIYSYAIFHKLEKEGKVTLVPPTLRK